MNARGLGYAVGKFVNWTIEDVADSKRFLRPFARVIVSAIGWLPLGVCLYRLQHTRTGNDKEILTAAAVIGGVAFVLLLWWFGGRRGFLWGLWLWLLSLGFSAGLLIMIVGLLAVIIVLSGDHFMPLGAAAAEFAVAGVVFVLCAEGLRRAGSPATDPIFP